MPHVSDSLPDPLPCRTLIVFVAPPVQTRCQSPLTIRTCLSLADKK